LAVQKLLSPSATFLIIYADKNAFVSARLRSAAPAPALVCCLVARARGLPPGLSRTQRIGMSDEGREFPPGNGDCLLRPRFVWGESERGLA